MVNNFTKDNIARLTFGDLNSEISSTENPSEIALAFTPTTLALLERTFVEFGESITTSRPMENNSANSWEHSTSYSGLSECSNSSDDDTSNGMEWTAGGKQRRLCDSSVSTSGTAADVRPARRLPGPRPSCKDEEMTPEDLQRRRRRRERNKMAAAKCRQRRVDQTNELLEETKSLEEDAHKLEKEIEALERLKHQLEFVLEAHMPACKADVVANQYPYAALKVEPSGNNTSSSSSSSSHQVLRPTSLPIATTTAPSTSMPVSTSANQMFFDFPLSGLTPLIDPLALFGSLDGTSPILLSPSSLLAQ